TAPASAGRRGTRRGRRRRAPRTSVRRKGFPPHAERLERVPEARFLRLLVERLVDVGRIERLDRRSERLPLALRRLERAREREAEGVQERERLLAHDDDELRLDDV